MKCAHFYTLGAFPGGAWRDILTEHFSALARIEFNGPCCVGLIGKSQERKDARRWLEANPLNWEIHEADEAWEQFTLARVRAYAKRHKGAVLYMHSKGSFRHEPFQDTWRRSMTCALLSRFEENLSELDRSDAVGCHWLRPDEHNGVGNAPWQHFAGNFWLARCDYLRKLPKCSDENRHEAEKWLGLGNPTIFDLCPGWPGTGPLVHRIGWPR